MRILLVPLLVLGLSACNPENAPQVEVPKSPSVTVPTVTPPNVTAPPRKVNTPTLEPRHPVRTVTPLPPAGRAFVRDVRSIGYGRDSSDREIYNVGVRMCNRLNNGESIKSIYEFYVDQGFGRAASRDYMILASRHLCTSHEEDVTTYFEQ